MAPRFIGIIQNFRPFKVPKTSKYVINGPCN